MAVTHFEDDTLDVADLTIYAELHNATDRPVKGEVSGSAAGASFAQTVELAAHEERTVVFSPQEFPQLRIHNPQLWWPWQMGQPHLEQLTMHFTTQGRITDEQSVEFGIREITSELTAPQGSRLFRVNGKRILIRGGGWSPDMMLRPNENRLREEFRMVRDMNLNAIRLEGKLESDAFFKLADEQGILIMAGWCCCDHWEDWKNWKPEDLTHRHRLIALPDAAASFASRAFWSGSTAAIMRRRRTWRRAYLGVESRRTGPTLCWPRPRLPTRRDRDRPVSR